MKSLSLIIALLLGSGHAAVGDSDARIECRKVKDRIRVVESKMRAGYTRAQGEKLHAELRRLRVLRKKYCR